MPIEFKCACGRKISAKDEHAGKKGKCPTCGAVITVPARSVAGAGAGNGAIAAAGRSSTRASAPAGATRSAQRHATAPPAAPAEEYDTYDLREDPAPASPGRAPASAFGDDEPGLGEVVTPRPYAPTAPVSAPRINAGAIGAAKASPGANVPGAGFPGGAYGARPRQEESSKFSGILSMPGYLKFVLAALIVVPTVLFIVRQGPMKAVAQWDKAEIDGENDVRTVLNRVITEVNAVTDPPPDPNERPIGIPDNPEVEHFYFVDPPSLMWRMPDTVEVKGRTTYGPYEGVYSTRTRELTATMELQSEDNVKIEAKCDDAGNVQALTINGVPFDDKMALSKAFDGYLHDAKPSRGGIAAPEE